MKELLPEGEELRRAIRWISEQLKENPATPLPRLIEEAGRLFDLSPRQSEYLWAFYRSEEEKGE